MLYLVLSYLIATVTVCPYQICIASGNPDKVTMVTFWGRQGLHMGFLVQYKLVLCTYTICLELTQGPLP